MKLNLCVKNPNNLINYNLSDSITINGDTVNFHQEIIMEEVKKLTKKQKKKFQQVAKTFLLTTVSFLSLSSKSMAASSNPPTVTPAVSAAMPPELMEFMMMALGMTVGVGVILSAILFASAGIMKMMGKKRRKDAEEWSVDIIKGFTQVLLSTPIIFLIYYIVSTTLKGSGWFISPF